MEDVSIWILDVGAAECGNEFADDDTLSSPSGQMNSRLRPYNKKWKMHDLAKTRRIEKREAFEIGELQAF